MKTYKIPSFIHILISFMIIIFLPFLPLLGLHQEALQLLGIYFGVLYLWITIGIDWPSLLCILLLGLLPSLGGFSHIFKISFGNSIFVFLLFTFICTYAFSKTQYVKKIAISFVTSSFAQKGPFFLATSFLFSVLMIGSFISPTVLFFIFFPILKEIFQLLHLQKNDPYASMMTIGLILCTSLSSALTPIAHVFPVLALGVLQETTGIIISQLEYMAFAIPSGLILFSLMLLSLYFFFPLSKEKFRPLSKDEFDLPTKSSTQEKTIIFILLLVILLWVLPDLLQTVFPGFSSFISALGIAFPPLLGSLLLCSIQNDGKPILSFNEAMSKGVSWPSLIMTASTLALSFALTSDDIGILLYIENSVHSITHLLPPILIVFIFFLWASIESNISSHMVTATLVTSVAIPIALTIPSINVAALCAVIGWLSCIGSSFPSSMPYVAVSISSRWITAKKLIAYGSIYLALTLLVAITIAYPLLSSILPNTP